MVNISKQVLKSASLTFALFLYGLLLIFGEKSKFSAPQPVRDEIKTSSSESVKTLLITSWRSGSTIIGELLNSHPGSIYNYEPFEYVGINRIYEDDTELALSAKNVINGLLYCNFSMVFNEYSKQHINYAKVVNGDLLPRTRFLQENCKRPYYKDPKCSHPDSLNALCQNSTLHISKTVRLGLDVALNFLDDPNVKIIYVVRDPRGLLNSRLERKWCLPAPRCIDPHLICKDLRADFFIAEEIIKERRNQILILRYEDFSMNIWNQTRTMFDFLGLPISTETQEFLLNHTQSERFSNVKFEVYNTYRDPKKAPFHWRKTLPFEKVLEVQEKCQMAMKLWGYKMVISEDDLGTENWNPLVEWQLSIS